MVYEQLPDTQTITAIYSKKRSAGPSALIYNVSLPVGILATCRVIHEEVRSMSIPTRRAVRVSVHDRYDSRNNYVQTCLGHV